MAGLINSSTQKVSDPLLKKIEAGIEAKVPPELKKEYLKVIVSGMKIMYDEKTSEQMIKMINEGNDVTGNIARGIALLVGMIYQQSGKKMSIPAGCMAAIVLMTQALEFASKTKGIEITPDLVAECTQKTSRAVMAKFGIGQEQIDMATKAGQAKQGGQPTDQPAQPQVGA